jgi:hypothetical protein
MPVNRAISLACPFPHAVDLLRFLGSLRGDPELVGYVEVENVIWWASLRVSELTGVSHADILATIVRLARNESLDGRLQMPDYGVYGEGREDLTHVSRPLHELDRDGSTAQIWRKLREKWPIFREAERALMQPKARSSEDPEPTNASPATEPATKRTDATTARKRGTVHQRMLDEIHKNPNSISWSQRQWSKHLHCSAGAIAAAPAWQTVKKARAISKAERLDRRQKRSND